jgi:hypothetical protein
MYGKYTKKRAFLELGFGVFFIFFAIYLYLIHYVIDKLMNYDITIYLSLVMFFVGCFELGEGFYVLSKMKKKV